VHVPSALRTASLIVILVTSLPTTPKAATPSVELFQSISFSRLQFSCANFKKPLSVSNNVVAQRDRKMRNKASVITDNSSARTDNMSALVECGQMFRDIAGEQPMRGGRVKAALRKVHDALPGWAYSRVRMVWYNDKRITVSGDELRQVERAARNKRNEEEARDEIGQLRARLARLEARLAPADESMERP
jgi:hypothetical protein